MRRHLGVLSHAFQFYAAWIGGLTTLSGVAVAVLVAVLGEAALGALLGAATIGLGWGLAAPFWLTGRGIRERRGWARVAGVVLSVLVITDVPFGLGLGLLGIGTLLDDDVGDAFALPARERPRLGGG